MSPTTTTERETDDFTDAVCAVLSWIATAVAIAPQAQQRYPDNEQQAANDQLYAWSLVTQPFTELAAFALATVSALPPYTPSGPLHRPLRRAAQ